VTLEKSIEKRGGTKEKREKRFDVGKLTAFIMVCEAQSEKLWVRRKKTLWPQPPYFCSLPLMRKKTTRE